jgi:uncharacterized protein YprB with RNaseH-like and TPR domain
LSREPFAPRLARLRRETPPPPGPEGLETTAVDPVRRGADEQALERAPNAGRNPERSDQKSAAASAAPSAEPNSRLHRASGVEGAAESQAAGRVELPEAPCAEPEVPRPAAKHTAAHTDPNDASGAIWSASPCAVYDAAAPAAPQGVAHSRAHGSIHDAPLVPALDRASAAQLPAAAAPGLPPWMRERLERSAPLLHAARRSVGDPAGLEVLGPGHARRRQRVPLDQAHGRMALAQGLCRLPPELAWLAKDAALEGLGLESARFLDIETTGLSGGAGSYAFLVAVGCMEGQSFRLDQHFLTHPAGEAALLAEVARELAAGTLLVSFFGKSFDRHRLEDKMRMHRVPPPFAGRPHLDLYHPLRRLYGKSFGDCRLSTLERALLGFERQDDLSGAFAPAAWFDHQAGRPHLLEGVFEHNRLDVLSLVALCAHLERCCRPPAMPGQRAASRFGGAGQGRGVGEAQGPCEGLRPDGAPGRLLSQAEGAGRAPIETRSEAEAEAPREPLPAARARARAWAKLHSQRRDPAQALAWLEQALELTAAGPQRREIALEQAEALWLLGRRDEALERYRDLLGDAHQVSDECGLRAAERLLPVWSRCDPPAARVLLASAQRFRARLLHPARAARDAARWRRFEAALAASPPTD